MNITLTISIIFFLLLGFLFHTIVGNLADQVIFHCNKQTYACQTYGYQTCMERSNITPQNCPVASENNRYWLVFQAMRGKYK